MSGEYVASIVARGAMRYAGTLLRSAGLAFVLMFSTSVAAQSPPNVIFIMTDDAGFGDFGVYGATDILTPNIDLLAAEGVRLTDFYANAPYCSPTRAGFISGRYQQRVGIEAPLGRDPNQGLPVTGRSLPALLKNNGYATALIGKWHLGEAAQYSPIAHGFDYFFGFKLGYIDYYQHDRGPERPDLWENDEPVRIEGYMTDLITERSIDYIERNASQPFFLSVQFNAPHWPYQRPDDPSVSRNGAAHLQPYSDDTSTRADYIAMLEHVDRAVGEILRTLDAAGIADNTLVIFTNDNGGEWLARNQPLFQRKGSIWEGGIRVPAILRWPGRLPAGRVSDQVGISMDLTTTILAVTDSPVPANADMEGINLMPILEGSRPEIPRTLFWREPNQEDRAVRRGDWKLVFDGDNNATFLFDLRYDIGERNDLANQRQDIAAELWGLLAAWEADVDAEAAAGGFH